MASTLENLSGTMLASVIVRAHSCLQALLCQGWLQDGWWPGKAPGSYAGAASKQLTQA